MQICFTFLNKCLQCYLTLKSIAQTCLTAFPACKQRALSVSLSNAVCFQSQLQDQSWWNWSAWGGRRVPSAWPWLSSPFQKPLQNFISVRCGLTISIKLLPPKTLWGPRATPDLSLSNLWYPIWLWTVSVIREQCSTSERQWQGCLYEEQDFGKCLRPGALGRKSPPVWGVKGTGGPGHPESPDYRAGEGLALHLDLTLSLHHHFPLYNLDLGPSIHLILIPVWNKQTLYNTVFTAQLEWGFVTPVRQQGS